MNKGFCLSDEKEKCYTGNTIEGFEEWYWHYPEWAVKEFIRLLKERFNQEFCYNEKARIKANLIIDKLAGEELIK